ncbi:MAG: biotin--[acetyl-CoA-carboxylase] ligase [Coriobacteriaceae bacterium]|nr:biotin--[acetyl-CoA-carboxylase] ligase [Coriobacteriaceae bacterium]
MLKESRINSQIAGEGYRVTCYDDVLSTNDLVKDAIRKGEREGLVVTALTQGAGYGRTGHEWRSPLGGLYFSMLLRPEVPMEQLPTLSQLTSFAVREALGDLDASLAEAVKIKWPNDVMCQGSKLCGVSLEQSEGAVCVGVGVNVFQPLNLADRIVGGKYTPAYVSELCNWGVMPRIDARGLSTAQGLLMEQVLVNILMRFGAAYQEWRAGGFETIRERYLENLYLLGEEVTVENLAGDFFAQGKVVNVNEKGQMVLRDAANNYYAISAGEVHLR